MNSTTFFNRNCRFGLTIRIPGLFLDGNQQKKREKKAIFKSKKKLVLKSRFSFKYNKSSRRFNPNSLSLREGRWEKAEHEKFITACLTYGNNWKKVSR